MITKISKRQLIGLSFIICHLSFGIALTSCSDMLEVESTRQNIEPKIEEKTDSAFYTFGILQAVQQVADQYVYQGELRGDLVKTTRYTDNNLRQLANFTATTANKYDSAYAYYRVINNCNYYLANADTALYRGATNVVIDKYISVLAIRAWAYLQLGRNYERVPFFTEPLTKISQIDDNNFPELALDGIVRELAPELEKYSGQLTTNLGFSHTVNSDQVFSAGSPSWTSEKLISPHYLFVPVDVVLGDMYLETQQFPQAAQHYITYLTRVALTRNSPYTARLMSKMQNTGRPGYTAEEDLPNQSNVSAELEGSSWSNIFANNPLSDLVTYVPMAVSRENGCTTSVPLTFGFNYYATSEENERIGTLQEPYVEQIQLLPSDALNLLSDSTEYYYYTRHNPQQNAYDSISIAKCGDMRLRNILQQTSVGDSTMQWIDKYKYANILLYRKSTVLLRLAEALNRLQMPDAAFAILKDGISDQLLEKNNSGFYYVTYLKEQTRQNLQTTYPLLSPENIALFPANTAYGIHCHGAGKAASDYSVQSVGYQPGTSPYQFDRMVGLKMQELQKLYGITVGNTLQDTINAVEDLICDELALETAFEGNRFGDLCRMARHKNTDALYGANFGSQWLARKIANRNQPADQALEQRLLDSKNWYLPFK